MAEVANGAIDGKGSMPALYVPDERIALTRDPFALLGGRADGKEFCGGTHANAEWHGHSAGTQSRLLPAAADQRLYSILQIAANIQGSDALRSVHLVSRKADHIRMYSQITHIHRQGACAASQCSTMP